MLSKLFKRFITLASTFFPYDTTKMGGEQAEYMVERITTVVIPQPDRLSTRKEEGRGEVCLRAGDYYTRHFLELEQERRSRDITHDKITSSTIHRRKPRSRKRRTIREGVNIIVAISFMALSYTIISFDPRYHGTPSMFSFASTKMVLTGE